MNIGSPLIVACRARRRVDAAGVDPAPDGAGGDREAARSSRLADRIAARFVGALLILAFVDGRLCGGGSIPSQALWVFVAVLVVSCPCALVAGDAGGADGGDGRAVAAMACLVTRGHAIETLARATHFVFDKTGTLTEGRPALVGDLVLGDPDARSRRSIAGGRDGTGLRTPDRSGACDAACGQRTGERRCVEEIRAVTGQGVEAEWRRQRHPAGQSRILSASLTAKPTCRQAARVAVPTAIPSSLWAMRQGWLALFRLSDRPRPSAAEALAALQGAGHRTDRR